MEFTFGTSPGGELRRVRGSPAVRLPAARRKLGEPGEAHLLVLDGIQRFPAPHFQLCCARRSIRCYFPPFLGMSLVKEVSSFCWPKEVRPASTTAF